MAMATRTTITATATATSSTSSSLRGAVQAPSFLGRPAQAAASAPSAYPGAPTRRAGRYSGSRNAQRRLQQRPLVVVNRCSHHRTLSSPSPSSPLPIDVRCFVASHRSRGGLLGRRPPLRVGVQRPALLPVSRGAGDVAVVDDDDDDGECRNWEGRATGLSCTGRGSGGSRRLPCIMPAWYNARAHVWTRRQRTWLRQPRALSGLDNSECKLFGPVLSSFLNIADASLSPLSRSLSHGPLLSSRCCCCWHWRSSRPLPHSSPPFAHPRCSHASPPPSSPGALRAGHSQLLFSPRPAGRLAVGRRVRAVAEASAAAAAASTPFPSSSPLRAHRRRRRRRRPRWPSSRRPWLLQLLVSVVMADESPACPPPPRSACGAPQSTPPRTSCP